MELGTILSRTKAMKGPRVIIMKIFISHSRCLNKFWLSWRQVVLTYRKFECTITA